MAEVKEYGYKEYPVLGGPDTRSMGIELEVLPIAQMGREEFARDLTFCAPAEFRGGAFVLKEDSSLSGFTMFDSEGEHHLLNGLEVVTGIMSSSWRAEYDWEALFEGLRSTCLTGLVNDATPRAEGIHPRGAGVGMHIHASGQWDARWEKHQRELVLASLFARMVPNDLEHLFGRISPYCRAEDEELNIRNTGVSRVWARRLLVRVSRLTARQLRREDVAQHFRALASRNSLVNPKNWETTEFRSFASAIRAGQMRYALSLVESLMDFAGNWLDGAYGRRKLPTPELFFGAFPQYAETGFFVA